MKHTLLKRVLCLVLALALLFSISANALAYTCSNWAKKELSAAAEAKIIPNTLKNENLTLRLTRQEMCDIVVYTFEQMTGTNLYPASTAHFPDTQNANICIAAELGIVNGYNDGTFRPNNTITRQEFAKVVANFYAALGWDEETANTPEPEPEPEPEPAPEPESDPAADFVDYSTVSRWAKESANILVGLRIIKGNNRNELQPLSNTSREEALAMMLRTYKFMMNYLGLPLPEENAQPGDSAPAYQCSNWAKKEMAQAAQYGIIPPELLQADLTQRISRNEICYSSVYTFMAITDTAGAPSATDHFSDTDDPIINLAFELGLVGGMNDGTFRPQELMTREQLFKILTNLLTATGWSETPEEPEVPDPPTEPEESEPATPTGSATVDLNKVFADAADIGKWAKKPIALMYYIGVMKGDANGRVNPTQNTTREEGIVMFLRAYQYIQPWYEDHPLTEIKGPILADEAADALVQFALQFEGYPYSYGDESPEDGFDCSGFIWYIYKQFGYNVNRTAYSLTKNGVHVEYDQLRPGDIICFWNSAHTEIGHVGLYIGDGLMIHAQSSSTGVCISDVEPGSYYYGRYYEARRIIE